MTSLNNSTSVYLIPGMKAKITASQHFAKIGNQVRTLADGTVVSESLVNGFYVENPDVGSIEPVENNTAVTYEHKKFSPNRIVFVARTGELGVVDVISVPIHDHSSIVTGGPAYGTYFADDENTENT
jgi:hypothetical protein